MKNFHPFFIFIFFIVSSNAQVVINEFDTDTEGQDFEEFVELKSDTPNASLDDYVLVFFNGSESGADSSYLAFDLDGFSTDVNGILVIGSSTVSPVPEFLIPPAIIQNGPDAVAIYQGSVTDFPEGTLATTTNLIDALAYDTNDTDDTVLLGLLGLTEQINEGENGNQTTESIQRNNNGSYTVTTPTPGALNDGSGIDLNGISFTTDLQEYSEGNTMTITFTTEEAVSSDLNFNFTLENETFTTIDYTGNTSVFIATGTSEVSVQIQFVEDGVNDGDEFAEIDIQALPQEYNRLTDNVKILVIDLDFTMAQWGPPINPTYGFVETIEPEDYYNSIGGLADNELRQAIQDIIANPQTVRTQTYADAIDILKSADQSPENSNEVWLLYTEQSRPKIDFQSLGGSNVGKWNREHTYPRSRGGFYELEEDEVADGMNIFIETNADSLRHGISDAHALRAADGPENSSRGNQDYGEYNGPTGNLGSFKGDVARAVLFMAVRYNDLEVVNGDPENTTVGELGDLQTLLEWHRNDPPDDFEMNRNNIVYTWQKNRNPFIDRPILVEHLWGSMQGEIYYPPLSIEENNVSEIVLYPNPVSNVLNIQGISGKTEINIFSIIGKEMLNETISQDTSIPLIFQSGTYILVLVTNKHTRVKHIIVE
ncbi:endonuclease [Marixanthomonas ophiurae]|uniref:T9SS C-terminal target domain-containing protein n=1 Tax=Marixanthomonas ophiurae TaxID=387659 RepID=A0A3E1Q6T5_9FLAO|nr:endonuclease [Marixanthomonas ophiurae]RFN57845.1 T9SS C-terminal target domain-containing protein [Marixanthomonas ophiurae]